MKHTCTECNASLDASMFYGRQSRCKSCVLSSQREYRRKNRAEILVREKDFRKQHSEKVRAWQKADHEKHRAERNAKARAYYEAHKAEIIAYQKQYAKDHPERVTEYKRRNKQARPETVRAEYAKNKLAYFARAAERRVAKTSRTPAWADKEEIAEFYKAARAFNARLPEIGFHVDHIVPLKSKLVSGLHVAANLQILTSRKNIAKGNRFWPDMP